MIIHQAFIWALSAFSTGIYLLKSAEPLRYLGPGIYMSPTFIRINAVPSLQVRMSVYVAIIWYTVRPH